MKSTLQVVSFAFALCMGFSSAPVARATSKTAYSTLRNFECTFSMARRGGPTPNSEIVKIGPQAFSISGVQPSDKPGADYQEIFPELKELLNKKFQGFQRSLSAKIFIDEQGQEVFKAGLFGFHDDPELQLPIFTFETDATKNVDFEFHIDKSEFYLACLYCKKN
ncbi:MAG: hypothetical protein KDD22_08765 [Bdellovibrionales bacterium]|nr:hypothetical protein [Bdellovibrionales bacterium]